MFALCPVHTALSANDLGDMSSRMRLRTGSDTESPTQRKRQELSFVLLFFRSRKKRARTLRGFARKKRGAKKNTYFLKEFSENIAFSLDKRDIL